MKKANKLMKKQKFIFLFFIISLLSCSTGREVVMPFRNMVYSGERLFPIEKNDSEKAFRAWINNGTSIDRVISVSSDSIFGNQANLTEFGFMDKKGLLKYKGEKIFKDKSITPISGFERFFEVIDSLKLIDYSNQDSFDYELNHQPFSLYVIEIKLNHKYNQFQFRTHFPDTTTVEEKYESIEKLLFNEFNYDFYMK
ncbi:MAG: hypothetical protein JXL97_08450 [Bacteroidales bacterium]|nr:hypothetical protein [Bacteroidales bacterium]